MIRHVLNFPEENNHDKEGISMSEGMEAFFTFISREAALGG